MATLSEDLRRQIARMEAECPDSWLLPHLKRQLRGLEAAKGRTPKEIFLNGVPYEPKSDERQDEG